MSAVFLDLCSCCLELNLYFSTITRRINEVTWDGEVIVVMDLVRIQPPYKPENCLLKDLKQTQALVLVQKLVSHLLLSLCDSNIQAGYSC